MTWQMRHETVNGLPKLAWLASADVNQRLVTVLHGAAVEYSDSWLVEGVWDDEFAHGDFHRCTHFFGSGIRLEDDRIYFVPSSALVDRLFYCFHENVLLVSNSMILLLAFTDSQLDPDVNYETESVAILAGIKDYRKEFRVVHESIDTFYQLYYSNLILDAEGVKYEERDSQVDIRSFDHYYELMTASLARIRSNYESPSRVFKLSAFSTLSAGYDSVAVTCLVKDIGVRTCFTSSRSNSAIPSWVSKEAALDDGSPIAASLGLETVPLDTSRSQISEDELYFLAPTCAEPELVFHAMGRHIEKHCSAAVVFTGYHGDTVWDAHTNGKYLSDQLLRGDISGLNLSEIRLKSGFINVAVPFMFARNIERIMQITRSPEMDPWRLSTSYDRPIPRRIAESAGINRQCFGMRKNAVIQYYDYPANSQLRRLFFTFLREHCGVRSVHVYLRAAVNRYAFIAMRLYSYMKYFIQSKALSMPSNTKISLQEHKRIFWDTLDLNYLMFIWSVDALREKARAVLPSSGSILNRQKDEP